MLVINIATADIISKGFRPTIFEMVNTPTAFPTKAIMVTTNGA